MLRRSLLLSWLLIAWPATAQVETSLTAKSRLFPEVGPGITALKHDAIGRYYVLLSFAVVIYDAQGNRIRCIPEDCGGRFVPPGSAKRSSPAPAPSVQAALVYGDDLDLDAADRIYVADRGANAVKVFQPDGTLAQSLPIVAPTSLVALSTGELAVASMKSPKLVTVLDARGKLVREFGEPAEATERHDLNRFLNIGRLAAAPADHLYYAFSYLPEPTVRKYDRFGYASLEIELTALEFQPGAQAARREIARQERSGTPSFLPTLRAIGVDPQTQEIWIAVGGRLLHFGPDGTRRGTYRIFTPEGVRIEAVAILVEPNRLLVAADPLGIFEFPRPEKIRLPP